MHRKTLGFTGTIKLPKPIRGSSREALAFNVQHEPVRGLLEDTADPAHGFIEAHIVHRLILTTLWKYLVGLRAKNTACHKWQGYFVLCIDVVDKELPMKLLEIQSSVRQEGSISRTLSHEFIQAWQRAHSKIQYKKRDVGINPPAHPTGLWTSANYMPPEERSPEMVATLVASDTLIEELLWADYLLLGVPMYNFSVPSTLKAYLDNVVRINRTFTFNPATHTFQGLAIGKKALIITPSAGNFVVGSPLGEMNFCDTYLRSLLGFIGISDVTVVPVPDQFMPDEIRQRELATARAKLINLAIHW
jgi:FMN-dependent NADH-azoreductase